MSANHSVVALIPARGGSKRIPRKNLRELGGKPLIVHTIVAAQQAGIFREIIVSTEDDEIKKVAEQAGAQVMHRQPCFALDDSPDIYWVVSALGTLVDSALEADAFCILRPTSPFRSTTLIRAAWNLFLHQQEPCHSLRLMRQTREHPGKQWTMNGGYFYPVLPYWLEPSDGYSSPWHSSPTQLLPVVFSQTAGLEIAWWWVPGRYGTISGPLVIAKMATSYDSIDLNTEDDWEYAEWRVQTGRATLPKVKDGK